MKDGLLLWMLVLRLSSFSRFQPTQSFLIEMMSPASLYVSTTFFDGRFQAHCMHGSQHTTVTGFFFFLLSLLQTIRSFLIILSPASLCYVSCCCSSFFFLSLPAHSVEMMSPALLYYASSYYIWWKVPSPLYAWKPANYKWVLLFSSFSLTELLFILNYCRRHRFVMHLLLHLMEGFKPILCYGGSQLAARDFTILDCTAAVDTMKSMFGLIFFWTFSAHLWVVFLHWFLLNPWAIQVIIVISRQTMSLFFSWSLFRYRYFHFMNLKFYMQFL